MNYIIGILIPPLALLLVGKAIQAVINAIVWILAIVIFTLSLGFGSFISFPLWIIAVIHALFVVHGVRNDERTRRIVEEARSGD